MSKSKWKEIERELARGGTLMGGYLFVKTPSTPHVKLHIHCKGKIPIRTWRKMWAYVRSQNFAHPSNPHPKHPHINWSTVIL